MHFWRRQWHPTPVLLPGKSHGRRSLVGCSPWSREELDTTEWLHFDFSLSCIGEGNGNPLQCSCPGMGEPGGLPSVGSHRVGHDWRDFAAQQHSVFYLSVGFFSFHGSSRRRGMIVLSTVMFLVPVTVEVYILCFTYNCIFSAQHTACHILVREQINSWAK